MATRTVTMADIAAQAGVSVPTVSKVLNGRRGVSAATRAHVERILTDSGYEPRARTAPNSGLIDIVLPGLSTQWATELLRGAEAEASRLGVDLVVTTTEGRTLTTVDWVGHLVTRGTDGVVLVVSELLPSAMDELARLRVPVVFIDPVGTDTDPFATVAATDWAGARDATEHLIGLGHRRIGFITGPLAVACHQDRLDGYRAALRRAGLPYDASLVLEGDSLVEGGRVQGRKLLERTDRPTAIMNGSDEQAYGVYQCARDLGLSIPGDLSVVGFDDVELCGWVEPQLTTVHQPIAGMAREATRMVIAMARGGDIPNPRVELATSIVVRESTGPAPDLT